MARFLVSCLTFVALAILAKEGCADAPERIVGGTIATVGEFPYIVSLREGNSHSCGGSIISDRHILTAAHCVVEWTVPDTFYTVVTGTNDLKSGGEVHNIEAILVHPRYKGGNDYSWLNDVALILLEKPIKFNELQKPIELLKVEMPVNPYLRLSGWGRLYKDGPLSDILLKTEMYLQDQITCQSQHPETIYSTQLCAVNVVGVGGCQGDSGGPLVYNGQLAGIVSWNVPCANGVSDVYTKVSAYVDFVESTMKNLR